LLRCHHHQQHQQQQHQQQQHQQHHRKGLTVTSLLTGLFQHL
jgi:hypothetical protein